MTDNQMTIPQMARDLQAVEQTIRRYIERFSEYFTWEMDGNIKRYDCPESLNVLKRIKELYDQGKKQTEIKDILAQEIQRFKPETLPEIPAAAEGGQNEYLDVLKGIKNILENLVDEVRELKEAVKSDK